MIERKNDKFASGSLGDAAKNCTKPSSVANIVFSGLNRNQNCEVKMEEQTDKKKYTKEELYRAQDGFVNLGCARQSRIDPNEEDHSRVGKADEEDRFCKVAASPNSHNLTEHGKEKWILKLQSENEILDDHGSMILGERKPVEGQDTCKVHR